MLFVFFYAMVKSFSKVWFMNCGTMQLEIGDNLFYEMEWIQCIEMLHFLHFLHFLQEKSLSFMEFHLVLGKFCIQYIVERLKALLVSPVSMALY